MTESVMAPPNDVGPGRYPITDWRGTPITVGAKVITRSATKYPTWRIGIVSNIGKSDAITVDINKSDSSWMQHTKKVSLWSGSVTVLTKDMFDDS